MEIQKKEDKQDTKQKKSFTDILTYIVAIPIALSPLFIFIGISNEWWTLFFIGLGLLAIGICCYLYSKLYVPQGKNLEEKLEYAFNDTTADSAFWWFNHLKEKPNNGDKDNIHLLHEKLIKIEPKDSSSLENKRILELCKKFILHVLPNNIDYTKKKYYMDKSVIKRMCTSKEEYVECIWYEHELTRRLILDKSRKDSDFLSPFYTVCYWELFSNKNREQIAEEMYNTFLKKVKSNYVFKNYDFTEKSNKLDENQLNILEITSTESVETTTFDTFLDHLAKKNEEILKSYYSAFCSALTSTSSSPSSFNDFEEKQKEFEWKMKVQQGIESKQRHRQEEDEHWKRLRAEKEARKRCERCANYNACGFARGIVNCGAFVPKKYN